MNIGRASKESGVNAKMIRYYEEVGLIEKAARSPSGYRSYRPCDVHTLRFIKRARDFGFSMEKIADLLALWRDRERASGDVKRLALEHVDALDTKIAKLQTMANALRHLAAHCGGDERPDCPIIETLAAEERPPDRLHKADRRERLGGRA
ncbi:MAG: Cu(I)-responsive transcriptional regulator [Pseudomonadota bacterium]